MLLTLLLDPHSFFPPGFWSIVLAVLLVLGGLGIGLLFMLRALWRSEKEWAKLLALAIGGGVVVVIATFWQGVLLH